MFNIRVYGLFLKDGCILLSDEYFRGMPITKFPGGGLEFGEGTRECLQREIKEELNHEISVSDLYYVVDYFQPSIHKEESQLISFYYFADFYNPPIYGSFVEPYTFSDIDEKSRGLRWVQLHSLPYQQITFPVDRQVAAMLRDDFSGSTICSPKCSDSVLYTYKKRL